MGVGGADLEIEPQVGDGAAGLTAFTCAVVARVDGEGRCGAVGDEDAFRIGVEFVGGVGGDALVHGEAAVRVVVGEAVLACAAFLKVDGGAAQFVDHFPGLQGSGAGGLLGLGLEHGGVACDVRGGLRGARAAETSTRDLHAWCHEIHSGLAVGEADDLASLDGFGACGAAGAKGRLVAFTLGVILGADGDGEGVTGGAGEAVFEGVISSGDDGDDVVAVPEFAHGASQGAGAILVVALVSFGAQ